MARYLFGVKQCYERRIGIQSIQRSIWKNNNLTIRTFDNNNKEQLVYLPDSRFILIVKEQSSSVFSADMEFNIDIAERLFDSSLNKQANHLNSRL
jgi:hypothetical protein